MVRYCHLFTLLKPVTKTLTTVYHIRSTSVTVCTLFLSLVVAQRHYLTLIITSLITSLLLLSQILHLLSHTLCLHSPIIRTLSSSLSVRADKTDSYCYKQGTSFSLKTPVAGKDTHASPVHTCSALYKTPHTPLITLHSHLPHLRNNYACTPPNPARPSNCCNTRISPANCLTRRSLHAPPTSRDPRETCDTLPRDHCTRNIDPSSCSHLCTGPTRRNALASVTYVGPSLGMPLLCSLTPSLSLRPLPPRAMPPPVVLLADRLDGGVPHGALSTSPL